MVKLITDVNLGVDVKYDSGTKKLYVDIDNDTIVRHDTTGKIMVDVDALGIVVVSDDEGNLLSVGSDTGAFVDKDKIKTVVGEMVASNTDGIDYDTITKTLTAYLASLAVVDSASVDLTIVTDTNADGTDGDVSIKADVKVSASDNNGTEIKADGVYTSNVATVAVNSGTDTLDVKVGSGAIGSADLEEVQGLDGTVLGYLLKA